MRKKAMQHLALVLALVLSLGIVLSGCKSTKDMVVGQWEIEDAVGITINSYGVTYLRSLEFFSDGTYNSNHVNYSGSYSIDGNRIKLTGILMSTLVYTFEIKGDTLYLYPSSSTDSYLEYKRAD